MPRSTRHDWKAIEQLAIAGVPYPVISKAHGVNGNTLRARAMRGGWPVPRRIEKAALMARAATGGNATLVQRGDASKRSGELATATAGLRLAANGERGSLLASELVLALLEAVRIETLQPLGTINEVATALTTVRKAAGMDKAAAPQVSLNLAMFSRGKEPAWEHDDGSDD